MQLMLNHCDMAFLYVMNASADVVRYIFGMLLYRLLKIAAKCRKNASNLGVAISTASDNGVTA
jgi:hypothetical protein